MNIIKANKKNIKKALGLALKTLKAGGIIAYPTETFYGLGVRFDNERALKRLYLLKKRPLQMAFSLIVGDIKTLSMITKEINKESLQLMKKFWPGPLTLLLPAKDGLSRFITHRGKVAVRVPGESFALRLASQSGFPITATSSNPSDMPPAKCAKNVIEYFGNTIDLIVDCGKTKGKLPSTIVSVKNSKIRIVRKGAIKLNG